MVFSSLVFLCIFLPLFLIAYFLFPKRRTGILVVFSLIFYAFGEPVWILALLFSGTVNYFFGLAIGKNRGTGASRTFLAIAIIINLSLLCSVKYVNFAAENVNALFGTQLSVPGILPPIGISFYTFQAISYIMDIYRGKTEAQRSALKFFSYITMFPQLVAGPIIRYSDIQEQLMHPVVTLQNFSSGATRFAIGLGKKVLLADFAGRIVDNLFHVDANFTSLGCWFGILFFALRVYFDFSGYSDMAIGLGRMIGFNFCENFNYPFIARSVTDYWRRWHISLTSFFRDYVYIPLGGNRRHQVINLVIVWGLTGLWHGSNWNYVLWGLYYGLLIILEKKLISGVVNRMPVFLGRIYTLILVFFGWPLFYFTSSSKLFEFVRAAFGVNAEIYDIRLISVLGMNAFLLPALIIGCTPLPRKAAQLIKSRFPSGSFEAVGGAIVMTVSFLVIIGQSYNPFLYFKF